MMDLAIIILLFFLIHWVSHHGLMKKTEQEQAVNDAYRRGFNDGLLSVSHLEEISDE